jgi:hypothetical protein
MSHNNFLFHINDTKRPNFNSSLYDNVTQFNCFGEGEEPNLRTVTCYDPWVQVGTDKHLLLVIIIILLTTVNCRRLYKIDRRN